MLREVGMEAELIGDETGAYLDDERTGEKGNYMAQKARYESVKGVPRYVIQGQYVIDGADDPAEFLGVFYQIRIDESEEA